MASLTIEEKAAVDAILLLRKSKQIPPENTTGVDYGWSEDGAYFAIRWTARRGNDLFTIEELLTRADMKKLVRDMRIALATTSGGPEISKFAIIRGFHKKRATFWKYVRWVKKKDNREGVVG